MQRPCMDVFDEKIGQRSCFTDGDGVSLIVYQLGSAATRRRGVPHRPLERALALVAVTIWLFPYHDSGSQFSYESSAVASSSGAV